MWWVQEVFSFPPQVGDHPGSFPHQVVQERHSRFQALQAIVVAGHLAL
jgi:hypothetical protein